MANDYIARQNSRRNEFDRDKVLAAYNGITHHSIAYYALIHKDEEAGIVEEIIGVKSIKGKLLPQKLLVIPFDKAFPVLGRNCYFGCGCNPGFHSYGYTGKGVRYYDYEDEYILVDNPDFIERLNTVSRTSLFTQDDLAEMDSRLAHCGFDPMFMYASDYIPLLLEFPLSEAIYKARLYRLLNRKAMETITADPKLFRFIIRNKDEIRHMAFRTVFNAYKKNPCGSPADYASALADRCEVGKQTALRNKALYAEVLKYTTRERILDYLIEQETEKPLYEDYLEACKWLRLDFSDTKVLFPHDFKAMHDNYVDQYDTYKKRQVLAAKKNQAKAMAETAASFDFLNCTGDGFIIMVAENKEQLIDQGKALSQCVGRLNYDERQAKGESVICFLTKADEAETPFVTIEVKITDSSLKVAQCYGSRNSLVPEVMPFVNRWISLASRTYRSRKHRIGA